MKFLRFGILLVLLLILNCIFCFATSDTPEEFSKNGLPLKKEFLGDPYYAVVYGEPFSEDGFFITADGNMYYDGNKGEHQYLGYNYFGDKFPNDKWFRKQSNVGNLFNDDYTNVIWKEAGPAGPESWRTITDPRLVEYMKTALFYDTDHPTRNETNTGKSIYDLFHDDYQKYTVVISEPTKEASGHILVYYKFIGSSKLSYNTIIIKSIPCVECVMTAEADITSIPQGETRDINIRIDTSSSFWTLYGEKYHDFTKREYWAGIGNVSESQKIESVDGEYTFKVKDVPPEATITVWSKVYSDELKDLGYEYAAEATTSIYIGEQLPPAPNSYDLDYNILSRKLKYPLSDTGITATLSLPRGSWYGSAWGSLNVTNGSPVLLRDFSVTNNPVVNESSSTIRRYPEIHAIVLRKYFNDDPENGIFRDLPNPLMPVTEDGKVSYGGSVSREYRYSYYCSGCRPVEGEEGEYTCPGHTGYGTANANFESGEKTKTIRAFIYNGMPVVPPKLFDNRIEYNYIYSTIKNLYWESEPYMLNVIRWMYHMDEDGDLYNPTAADGRYQRKFTQQCSAKIEWSVEGSMEENYERSRRAALNRDYSKSESDKAIFASDKNLSDIDYPIKSGYYFNPCGSYEFIVETVTYKTSPADTKDHKDLVEAVIKSFRYETDLMYINSDKEAVNIQDEPLPVSGGSYGRRPAALTAQDPTGVDGIVLLEVFDRSTNGSRYTKTVEELWHSEEVTGNTHSYLKGIMEGYLESGTGSSNTTYKYREYIKDGQHIYKITEKTRVTIRVNPYNRNVYTHAHMPDGKYTVRAWIGDIDLSGINNEYKKLGVLRGINSLDEIEVTVKGSMYDDVSW